MTIASDIAPFRHVSHGRASRARRRIARDSEHAEQAALFRWAEYARARLPELSLLFAIPNGGHRNKVTAARLKAEGVKRGVPDVCLPVARGGAHGLYIELKAGSGRATVEQIGWIRALRRQGYAAKVCRGWEETRDAIERYLAGRLEGESACGEPNRVGCGGMHEQAK